MKIKIFYFQSCTVTYCTFLLILCTRLAENGAMSNRETREGWALLTVETEVNRDTKSTNERSLSLVALLGLSCRYNRFLYCLAALISPVQNIAGRWGQRHWNSVWWGKSYFVLGRLEQPRQNNCLSMPPLKIGNTNTTYILQYVYFSLILPDWNIEFLYNVSPPAIIYIWCGWLQ